VRSRAKIPRRETHPEKYNCNVDDTGSRLDSPALIAN
jgi:hypothetical protein